ncbi:DNA-binding protein [Saccharothrix yanglingensis]|uniref:DNA-binding protein n=1 Tax=Saccharothrix yanglingensis TaxID=659496 RepID=A0ABU0X8P8_9PSEU|nr:DNA-binding protein [Saccharothrix yanglingensis]MDQ2588500.1 DNA-binding protein [Saccharothrix yanglingensis]
MSPALEAVLARAGLQVTPDEFLSLVADAAKRLAPPHPDPGGYFSPDQRDALVEVGLDLGPHRPSDDQGRARTVVAHAVLRDSALTVADAARQLGVDTSRIRHRLGMGRLVGWKDRGSWRLPAWQFAGDGVLPGLEAVLAAVPADQPALVVAGFMTTEQEDLSVDGEPTSPREWLLAGGDPRRVTALAAQLGTPA